MNKCGINNSYFIQTSIIFQNSTPFRLKLLHFIVLISFSRIKDKKGYKNCYFPTHIFNGGGKSSSVIFRPTFSMGEENHHLCCVFSRRFSKKNADYSSDFFFLVGAFRRKTQTIVVTSFFLVGAFRRKTQTIVVTSFFLRPTN